MLVSRALFYDGYNLDSNTEDSVNNYSKVEGAQPVYTKGDVIDKLKNDKYNVIVLAGHACPNVISIGAGMGGPDYQKTKEVTLQKFQDSKKFFKKCLSKHFIKGTTAPILFLAGCELYDNTNDATKPSLLKKISEVMEKVLVIGPCSLVKPELKKNSLNIKLESKVGVKADFDFSLTLAAFWNGKRIEDIETILELTECEDEKSLQRLLCKWELQKV
jgi:hypothetical protein